MSIYLALDGKLVTQVASNKGWSDVIRYVEGLPEQYRTLKRFVDQGEDKKTKRVAFQFKHALQNDPPEDETITRTISELLDLIGDSEDAVSVTNGFV